MKHEIRLKGGIWTFDESDVLGPAGGFGEVFRGSGDSGTVAIKRLKLTADAAAHRELTLGESLASRTLKNVVPIIDFGQDAQSDRYFLIMPICQYSLQDYLNRYGPIAWTECAPIIDSIIDGLSEVGDIVHRDLKPANVLYHDGKWKISDFGIARFVEDSTSLRTLKNSLTPQYAAPEQWQMQRSTKATDIYSLGCMFYTMISGKPPYSGDVDEIREGHLKRFPDDLEPLEPRIKGLVRSMLRKTPEGRPSLDRCKKVVNDGIQLSDTPGRTALEEAGLQVVKKESDEEAARLAAETQSKKQKQQAGEAYVEILGILNRVLNIILESSEAAKKPYDKAPSVRLGPAELSFTVVTDRSGVKLPRSGWSILVATEVYLKCRIERIVHADREHYSVSSNLVYAMPPDTGEYRWYEVSFWSFNGDSWKQPHCIQWDSDGFDVALSATVGVHSIAFGPTPIDAEDEQEFQNRWIGLFARAAKGSLRPPRQMPPPPDFFSG
ncbi:Serine/threonine protein kinase [Marinovum algicola DG 898]|nr:Serine/threonine protein kinase [Marinovum algicola DG 898]